MKFFLDGLIGLSGIVAILVLGSLLHGLATNSFSNGRGMAILAFQLYGAIASVLTILLSTASFAMGWHAVGISMPTIGLCVGILGLVVLGVMMFF